MVADAKPQHRKKEESEQLRGERDKIKFIIGSLWLICKMSKHQRKRMKKMNCSVKGCIKLRGLVALI